MPDRSHPGPDLAGLTLSNMDIIKLHAAVTMSICGVLHEKGLVSNHEMSAILLGQIRDEDTDPWARIVQAIAGALVVNSEAPASAPQQPQSPNVRLTVLIGGLDQSGDEHEPL